MNCIGPRTARPRHSLAASVGAAHRRPHVRVKGSTDPLENVWKIRKRKHAKNSSFLCLCYILRAIRTGRCRERRYADHIFIQIYFRMHHCVVKFSKFSSRQAARGHWPLTKILRTFLVLPPGKSFRVYTGHDQSWGLFTDTTPKHYFLRLTLDVASVLLLNGENIMRKTDYCSLYQRDVMTVGMRCPEPSTKSMHTASSYNILSAPCRRKNRLTHSKKKKKGRTKEVEKIGNIGRERKRNMYR